MRKSKQCDCVAEDIAKMGENSKVRGLVFDLGEEGVAGGALVEWERLDGQ